MNIKSIKERATQLLQTCKPQYIRILTIMMLIGLIQNLCLQLPGFFVIIGFVVVILFLPFSHGYVVSSLKIVRNNHEALSDNDAFVGFKRFKNLFPTYLLSGLVNYGIVFILVFFSTFIFMGMVSGMVANDSLFNLAPIIILYVFGFLLIISAIVYFISLYLFAVPYLLEQYQMKNGRAISESIQFIKGHKIDLFKLDISFLGWMILEIIFNTIVANLLGGSIFPSLLGAGLGGLFAVYTYMPKLQLSRAIFFEEIAYKRYGTPSFGYNNVSENEGE